MSPVHVIVGEDPRAQSMWAGSFAGAVDLYAFARNVDAFERLTAAQAPVDLIVLTPAQQGPFNLTPDQFVARLLEGPLGSSRNLANLHVIVVGQPLRSSHPRAISVSTLDAAIRLVKFGEVETAPRPAARAQAAPPAPQHDDPLPSGTFSASVISRIWDEADAASAPARPSHEPVAGGGPRRARTPQPRPATNAAAATIPQQPQQLFTRSAPAGFVVAPGPAAAAQPQPHPVPQPLAGGGPAPVGAPGESIEVSSGTLLPSRPYQLPHGGGYRGPAMRGGQVQAASHAFVGGQPVPPALASQVQSMVYGGGPMPPDPLLTWSSSSRDSVVARGVPVPAPASSPQAVAAAPVAGGGAAGAPQPVAMRTVPLEPPPGVYAGAAAAPAAPVAAAAPPMPADPFLQRAEQGGGASFG